MKPLWSKPWTSFANFLQTSGQAAPHETNHRGADLRSCIICREDAQHTSLGQLQSLEDEGIRAGSGFAWIHAQCLEWLPMASDHAGSPHQLQCWACSINMSLHLMACAQVYFDSEGAKNVQAEIRRSRRNRHVWSPAMMPGSHRGQHAGSTSDIALFPAQVLVLQHERCWVRLQNGEQLLQAAVPPGLCPQGWLRLLP